MEKEFDVVIIGAGPSGIGCAIALQKEGFNVASNASNYIILNTKSLKIIKKSTFIKLMYLFSRFYIDKYTIYYIINL